MKPIIMLGTLFVHLALISYGIGIVQEQMKHHITKRILIYLGAGLFFDIVATACMIIGSGKGFISLHGALGYSCLLAMALDSALAMRYYLKLGEQQVPRSLHLLSRYAYVWWVLGAYVTGTFLVILRISLRKMGA